MSNVIDISHFLPQTQGATTITTLQLPDDAVVGNDDVLTPSERVFNPDGSEQQSDDTSQEGAS